MKNQKGFIPIIFIIIGAVVITSATFGIVEYKEEITANISKIFNSKIETSDIKSIEQNKTFEELKLFEKPIIEKKIEEEQNEKINKNFKRIEQKNEELKIEKISNVSNIKQCLPEYFCNDKCWLPCSNEDKFICPLSGDPYCEKQKFQSITDKIQGEKTTSFVKHSTLSNFQIINRVKPATVFIKTTKGVGSGMIIDSSGYILTNAHVLWGITTAKIKLSDGRLFSANVIGRDEIIDLAILKIIGDNLPSVTLGNSDNVMQGDDVFTLGYPFGLEDDVSFKEGTISRRISSDDATYLETSAEIHPGNSGGPLVNKYGDVIGINTASYGQSIEGIVIGETIKLAIPINIAKNIIPQLKNGRKIIIDHTQYINEPIIPIENTPSSPSQSQALEDQANQALLESLYDQNNDEAWERFYSFNDAWRENPAHNCRNEATYSYEIAQLVMGALEDNMIKKYGKSLPWRKTIQFTFKSWCVDKGY